MRHGRGKRKGGGGAPAGYAQAAKAARERTEPEGQKKAPKKAERKAPPKLQPHTVENLWERGRKLAGTIRELLVQETTAHAEHQRLIKERKERTKELVALWEDADQGQDHLPLQGEPAEEDGEGAEPAEPMALREELTATLGSHELKCVRESSEAKWAATVDGKSAGEHTTLEQAKMACVEFVAVVIDEKPRPKKSEQLAMANELSWARANPFRNQDNPTGAKEFGYSKGSKTATLKETSPGKWTGRVDGKPIAVDLPLSKARQLVETELGGPVAWEVTEDFLPEAQPEGNAAGPNAGTGTDDE